MVASLPTSGSLTKLPDEVSVCEGVSVSATATNGAGGAGTINDVVEYRYDGASSWQTYTPGTELSTTGHNKVEIRTYRTATGAGCTQSTPNMVTWIVKPQPAAQLTVTDNSGVSTTDGIICVGGQATLKATGGTGYTWSTGATSDQITETPSTSTDYWVEATNADGCKATKTFKVVVNSLPTPQITVTDNSGVSTTDGIICVSGQATLKATGGTGYTWSTGATSDQITVTPTTETEYTVTVKDANNCSNTASRSISVNPLPVATFTTTPGTAACAETEVTYTTQSGQSNYVWSIPGVAGTDYQLVNPLTITSATSSVTLKWKTAGSRKVTVTYKDANDCAASTAAEHTMTINALPKLTTTGTLLPICFSATLQNALLAYSLSSNSPTT
ncbi:MAG: hypothetical protein EOP50_15255, partial [Sphingobacteriales bacterium]